MLCQPLHQPPLVPLPVPGRNRRSRSRSAYERRPGDHVEVALVGARAAGLDPDLRGAEQAREQALFDRDVLDAVVGNDAALPAHDAALDDDLAGADRVAEAPPGEQSDGDPISAPMPTNSRMRPGASRAAKVGGAAAEHLRDDAQPAHDQGGGMEPPRFARRHSGGLLRHARSWRILTRMRSRIRSASSNRRPGKGTGRRGCRRCGGSGWRGRSCARSGPGRRRYAGRGRTARRCGCGSTGRGGCGARPLPRDSPGAPAALRQQDEGGQRQQDDGRGDQPRRDRRVRGQAPVEGPEGEDREQGEDRRPMRSTQICWGCSGVMRRAR